MYNKNICRFLVFTFVFVLFAAQKIDFVNANAGPPLIMPEGGAGGIIFENNQSIRISSEQLSFSISDGTYGSYTADVSAMYSMENILDEAQHVRMLFPFYTSIYSNNGIGLFDAVNSISVMAGGEEIPYKIRMLDGTNYSYGRDTTKFIQMINAVLGGLQQPKEVVLDLEAEYDIYYFLPVDTQNVNDKTVTIQFESSDGDFRFLGASERFFSNHDGEIEMGLWNYMHGENNPIFAICSADSSGFTVAEGKGSIDRIERIDDIKTFFINYIQTIISAGVWGEAEERQDFFEDNPQFLEDMFNIIFSREQNTQGSPWTPQVFMDIMEFIVLGITYEVDFAALESREVEVSYDFSPYMMREKGVYTHTYVYFLSPAGHWKDFNNLNISVDVSDTRYKYMLNSSVQFEYDDTLNVYSYNNVGLPQGELVFKLFYDEKLPVIDAYSAIFMIVVAIACIPIAGLVLWLVIRRKKIAQKKAL